MDPRASADNPTNRWARPLVMLGALALSVLGSGCASRIPFTHEIRSQHELSDDDLRHLQFYVSHTVTLRRELESRGRTISGGQLEVTTGKVVEEVVIEEETPGVVVNATPDFVSVSFEEGSALTFALQGSGVTLDQPLRIDDGERFATPPDPFPGEHVATPSDPVGELFGSYFVATEPGSNFVTFRGKVWEAVEDSLRAHLMIDSESLEEVVERRTVLGGRRVGRAQRVTVTPL